MLAGYTLLVLALVQDWDASANNDLYGNAYTTIRRFGWQNTAAIKFGTPITLESGYSFSALSQYIANAYELFFFWHNEQKGGITINGQSYPIELILINDDSSGSHVEYATDQLVNLFGVNLLFGPYSSGLTNHAAKIANSSGAVMLCSGAASAYVFEDRPQVFGTSTPANKWFIEPMTVFAGMHNPPTKIAILQEDVAFTKFACSSLPDLAAATNMTIVHTSTVSFNANMSEVGAAVAAIAASQPDAVFSCNYDTVCKNFVRAAHQANFNPKAFVLTTCVPGVDFINELGVIGTYIIGTAAWTHEILGRSSITNLTAQDFFNLYYERFNSPPHYLSAAAFAGASMMVHAIETTNSIDSKIVADAIRAMNVQTEYGRVVFDNIGLNTANYTIVEWRDNVHTTIVDSQNIENPTYPKPTWSDLRCLDSEPGLSIYGYTDQGQGQSCGTCPDGQASAYDNVTYKRICRSCPLGQTLVTTGSIGECKFCAAGRYWCGEGWYAPSYPDYITSDLRESTYCDATTAVAHCRDCPAGRYTNDQGHSLCTACTPGRYQNVPGMTACTSCGIWDTRYPTAYAAAGNSVRCNHCPDGAFCEADLLGLHTSYSNANEYYLVEADPLDYGSDLVLGALFKCPHGDGKACVASNQCYVDEYSDEVSMEGPFCGICKPGFARGETFQVCTKCKSPFVSWLLGFGGACIIFAFSAWLTIGQLLKDPRAMLPAIWVILRQFMNYVHITAIVIPFAHLSTTATDILKRTGAFAYVTGSVSPLSSAVGTECYLRHLFPDLDIYKVWIIAGFLLVPCWLVFDVCLYSSIWALCKMLKSPPPTKRQFVLGLALNLYVLQPRLTKLFLVVFDCKYLDYPRLMVQLTVKCDTQLWGWQFLSVLGLLVFSFGIPFALVATLYSYRRSDELQSVECAEMFGFLFQGYKPGFYYWEAILMTRKVLFQIVAYIPWLAPVGEDLETQKAMTSISLMLLSVIFLGLHLRYRPYDFRDFRIFHEIESAMLWATFWTSLSQVWLYVSTRAWIFTEASDHQQRNEDLRDNILSIMVIVFHARFFLLVIWGIIGSSVRATKQYQRWMGGGTTVEITRHGMRIEALSVGSKGFLADLIQQAAKGVMRHEYFFIDDLRDAVKQLAIEAYYQKDIAEFEARLPFLQQQLRGYWFWLPERVRQTKIARRLEKKVYENALEEDCPWRNDPYNHTTDLTHFTKVIGSSFTIDELLFAYVSIAWRQDGQKSLRMSKARTAADLRNLRLTTETGPSDEFGHSMTDEERRALREEASREDVTNTPAVLNSVLIDGVAVGIGKPEEETINADVSASIPALPGVQTDPAEDTARQDSDAEEWS